jgi:hypothetical protein
MTENCGKILLALPEEISRNVLVNWLGLQQGVTRVDSAFCSSRTRASFLSLAYGVNTMYTTNKEDNRFDSERGVEWYLFRNVRINGIEIGGTLRSDFALRNRFLDAQGPHIQWVDMQGGSESVLIDIMAACWQLHTLTLLSVDISESDLARAMRACKNLTHLTIVKLNVVVPLDVALPTLLYLTLRVCQVHDFNMNAIGSNCSQLQSLRVFKGHYITDPAVRAVLQGCPLLRETDVDAAKYLSFEVRTELAQRAQLASIDCAAWDNCNNELAQMALKVSPNVTRLVLSPICNADATLLVCGQHCPLLEYISIQRGRNAPSSAGVLHLFKPGSRLREVWFESYPLLGDEVLLAMAKHCPLLRVVVCNKFALTDDTVVQLAEGCPDLVKVDLTGTKVGDIGVTALATCCRGLQVLCLFLCPLVTLEGVRALAENSHHLTALTLPPAFEFKPLPALKAAGAEILFSRQ